MKKRKYNLLQRILIKANSLLYRAVGKCVDLLVKMDLYGEFPYEIKGHFGDVIELTHPYPQNYQEKDKALFDEWKWYETFPHDLFLAKKVLLTPDGVVLKKHRTFIRALPHPIFRFQYGILYNLKTRIFYRKFKTDPGKNYLLFYDNWSWNNYFHWIIDALCRAELVRRHVQLNFTIILPEASPKYLTDTLKLYGYTDFIYLPPRSKTRIENLYVMNYAAWSGQQHPEILKAMVNYISDKLEGEKPAKPFRKIYVSRAKQFSRRVENENEILALLEPYGFETVYFEGMGFNEQVQLMQSATHFITSHGANMTNLVFLPVGAKIFELLNDRKPNFCYWSVANCLGHSYSYQLCPITGADHVQVDAELFKKNLELLMRQ